MNRFSKKILLITFISTLMISFAACTDKTGDNKPGAKEKSNDKLKKVYSAYIDVLKANEADIKGYDWQQEIDGTDLNYLSESNGHGGTNRQIAICDINGDDIPELLFMKKSDNEYCADLSIYTYMDDKAQEIQYSLPEPYDKPGKFQDVQVAGGTSYVIYKGDEKNSLYMFNSIGDINWFYTIYKYNVKGGEMKLSKTIENHFVGEFGKNQDKYKIDGKDVSTSEGEKAFDENFSKLKKSLIYSGRKGEKNDCTIWLKFKSSDAMGMSYEDAINKLSKQSK